MRHQKAAPACPLPGVQRSCRKHRLRSESDPKRSSSLFADVGGAEAHSGLILAARITLPHFSVSSAINLPKSLGEPGSGVPPRAASRALKTGSARAALISAL